MKTINMTFVRNSPITGVARRKTFEIPIAGFAAWDAGEIHIQDAFPDLSAADREFIISGCTDEEFNELFPPELPEFEGGDPVPVDYNKGGEA